MSTPPTTNEHTQVAVIGAGQAGLAVGVALQQRGIEPLILEAGLRVGDSWRARWDSLRLYNPANGASLPGLAFPGAGDRFPAGHEVADYLETYATTMGLTVRTDTAVRALRVADGGGYALETDRGTINADAVVITTGAYRTPFVPELAERLDPAIRQIHSSDYRRPDQLADGPVLVVGASHSGADLALEAALAGHETHLSGAIHGQLPFSIDSRRGRIAWPILRFAWTKVLTIRTPMGRRLKARVRHGGAPLLRVRLSDLTDAGVVHHPVRTTDVSDGRPMLDDGTVLDVNTVVWCTGFRPDYGWVHLDRPFAADDGWPAEQTAPPTGRACSSRASRSRPASPRCSCSAPDPTVPAWPMASPATSAATVNARRMPEPWPRRVRYARRRAMCAGGTQRRSSPSPGALDGLE